VAEHAQTCMSEHAGARRPARRGVGERTEQGVRRSTPAERRTAPRRGARRGGAGVPDHGLRHDDHAASPPP
jgi:hypothetical protein